MDAVDKWGLVPGDEKESEKINAEHISYSRDVWRRFRHNKASLAGLVMIAVMILAAVFGPSFLSHRYDTQTLAHVNLPPRFDACQIGERLFYVGPNLKLLEVSPEGYILETIARSGDDAKNKRYVYEIDGAVYYMSYAKSPVILEKEDGGDLPTLRLSNKTYVLGTDALGRDMLVRLLHGARISLIVAFVATLVNFVIGVLYGSISAYLGGTADLVMMRVVDIIATIPLTLYVILIMVLIDNSGLNSIIIALGLVYWVNMARVVRGQILSLKQQEYVQAAKIMGSSTLFILRKHLIPNAMGPIIVNMTMLIPSAIFIEAFMSFIGLGVTAPMASLGTMCNDALESIKTAPYQLFFPALTICIAMFAFNFIGDGLRDALDPRMRK